jgi:site-specific DNA-methyltransferase (adenine-specific)
VKGDRAEQNSSVFSTVRSLIQPRFAIPPGFVLDQPQKLDGFELLQALPTASVPLVIFDPQYRALLDRQGYGNEGKQRQRARVARPQMNDETIARFVRESARALMPMGHLMLWTDKYSILEGRVRAFLAGIELQQVDLFVWDKQRIAMGYRGRQRAEYLVVAQKPPARAKGVWCVHNIPDVWNEKIAKGDRLNPHAKPIGLQTRLIEAVTNPGDIVVDPAAGSYSVLKAARCCGRRFLGCDLVRPPEGGG